MSHSLRRWTFVKAIDGTKKLVWSFNKALEDESKIKWRFLKQSSETSNVNWKFQKHLSTDQHSKASNLNWNFRRNLSEDNVSTVNWKFEKQSDKTKPLNWKFENALNREFEKGVDHNVIRHENKIFKQNYAEKCHKPHLNLRNLEDRRQTLPEHHLRQVGEVHFHHIGPVCFVVVAILIKELFAVKASQAGRNWSCSELRRYSRDAEIRRRPLSSGS